MVRITVTKNKLTASGHAADAAGCAAVSAILYALAGGLENLDLPFSWSISGGSADIRIPNALAAQPMLLMAEVGLRQIAAVRPDIEVVSAV